MKKSLGIYLQHKMGDVSVQGWVQDRIRVKLKRRILADSEEQAELAFQKLDLITLETAERLEVRVGHVQGIDLVSKMRNQHQNSVVVDLEIKAPFQNDFTVVLGDGKSFKLDTWKGGVTVLGKNNNLTLNRLSLSRELSLNCLLCSTTIKDSKVSGHLLVGSRGVLLTNVEAEPSLSIDGGTEEIRIENSKGKVGVHSKTGRLSVAKFLGSLQFQSVEGGADLQGFSGNLNIQTQTGQVVVDADEVKEAFNIDTEKSDIQVSLPPQFMGALDLMSLRGEVVVQFPYETKAIQSREVYGPASPGRVDGQIGSNDRILMHAYSKQGGVRILRKAPSR